MPRGYFNSTESNAATTAIATKDPTLPEETAIAADTTESLAAAADVPAADIVQQLAQAAPAEADNARQHLV
jgi:predicted NBD/HSP70 family sugar kinase